MLVSGYAAAALETAVASELRGLGQELQGQPVGKDNPWWTRIFGLALLAQGLRASLADA